MGTLPLVRQDPLLLPISGRVSAAAVDVETRRGISLRFRVSFSGQLCGGGERNPCVLKPISSPPSWKLYQMKRRKIIASSGAAHSVSPGFAWSSRIRGICFYLMTGTTAMILILAMIAAHPLVLLLDRYQRKVHHRIAKIWAMLTVLPFYRVEFQGLENLPPDNVPAVYVSNHQSFLDIYTLLTMGKSFKFISKRSIFLFPIIGWAMFLLGTIPIRRMDTRSQMDCLKRCIELVKKGGSVFFFPEGTRSKDGKLGTFKKGAFSVASKTGVPVVPIALMGTGELMPTGMEGFLNSGGVKVVVHKPLQGSSADELLKDARSSIANTLLFHGYGVH